MSAGSPENASPSLGSVANPVSFALLAEIATGDTARVDLCKITAPPTVAGRLIAVKRLHPHVADDPTFVKQFLDEVRITHWLHHPNVVEVAGWGADQGGSYLAVELVQGVSLLRLMKTVFETGEAFNERMVVYVASRICRGLGAAHSLRAPNGELLHLVHRDLTPGNILIGFNGEVKITDFGMAKATQRLTQTLTGMRKGEPTYMAPEQAMLDLVDARADLFSLGVILFELFAGRRPWIAKSDLQMFQITAREPHANLAELRPKIDPQLVAIVNRCLERDPASRWQTAQEIGAKLDEWLGLHGYQDDNEEALARFVRRNAMRQMRWFERAVAGSLTPEKTRDVPRVPTYTEDSQHPSLSFGTEDGAEGKTAAAKTASSAAKAQSPIASGRPVVPRPADPRSLRAASAVEQLKKLAPPVEPKPRDRRRLPTLDEGETDVELRIPTNKLKTLQSMVPIDEDGDEDETGEEVPTLVQPDHPEIAAMRAEARRKGTAGVKGPKPTARLGAPNVSLVDDFQEQTTNVKAQNQPRARPEHVATQQASSGQSLGGGAAGVLEAEGDVPTLLVDDEDHPTRPRGAVYVPPLPPLPPLPPPAPTGNASNAGATFAKPSEEARDARATARQGAPDIATHLANAEPRNTADHGSIRPPPARVIPRSPDIPVFDADQRRGVPQPAKPARDDVGSRRPPPPATQSDPPRGAPPPPAVLEHIRAIAEADRDAILAEADRFSIEATRSAEEARAAQLRAERKTVMAHVAAEAARIAAEAVRLLQTEGLAEAQARLAEARVASKSNAAPPGASLPPPVPSSGNPELPRSPELPRPLQVPSPEGEPPKPIPPAVISFGPPPPLIDPPAAPAPTPLVVSAPLAPAPLGSSVDDDFSARVRPGFLGMGAAASGIAVAGVLAVVIVLVALLGR